MTGKYAERKSLRCLRCGWTWFPRIRDVRVCPKCRNPRWDQKRDNPVKSSGGVS